MWTIHECVNHDTKVFHNSAPKGHLLDYASIIKEVAFKGVKIGCRDGGTKTFRYDGF
jgi:hypothetical protein